MTYKYTQIDIPLLENDPYTVVNGQVTHYGYEASLSNTDLRSQTDFEGAATKVGPGQVGTQTWIADKNGVVTESALAPNIDPNMVGRPTANGHVVDEAVVDGVLTYRVDGVVINAPGSQTGTAASLNGPTTQSANFTTVLAVNHAGVVAGGFFDTNNASHGFVDDHGSFTQIDIPGATATCVIGINDQDQLTGSFTDAAGAQHMFTAEQDQFAGIGTPINDPAVSNYAIRDQTTGAESTSAGTAYSGPVAGLTSEYINITSDNLNVTAHMPNVFIHSGSGEDALDVSAAHGGVNVLDGGTGSNFLVGNDGATTFFADNRAATADIWSTLVNVHSGDSATIWGITVQDFAISMHDDLGAAGFTGLTIEASKAGAPNASVTLAGFSQADLASGKVSISYGRTSDTPNLAGSDYMQITAR